MSLWIVDGGMIELPVIARVEDWREGDHIDVTGADENGRWRSKPVRYVARGECHKLPPDNNHTCIVRHEPTGMTMEFGYWKCSRCGCNCVDGAKYCMNCGARVVSA